MVALRGVPQDYDHWAEDLGCAGWSWRDLKPWFLAVEDDADLGDGTEHGKGGPIPLERPPSSLWSPWDLAVQDAARNQNESKVLSALSPVAQTVLIADLPLVPNPTTTV